jgi:hypothetical protein
MIYVHKTGKQDVPGTEPSGYPLGISHKPRREPMLRKEDWMMIQVQLE